MLCDSVARFTHQTYRERPAFFTTGEARPGWKMEETLPNQRRKREIGGQP
jgi:hypothetical protein